MRQSQENRAKKFVTENTALLNNHSPKRCPSAALLGRFALRNSVAFLLGITAGAITNGFEEKANVSKHLSDVVSCATALIVSYGMDWVLEKYWPTNPYSPGQSIFSGRNSNNIDISHPNKNIPSASNA